MPNRSSTTILRRPAVELMTGLSRSTIYQQIADKDFPKPLKLGKRAVGWRESDIIQWLDSRTQGEVQP
jgi:prophage regulatory protein